jgi:hypothetical protein
MRFVLFIALCSVSGVAQDTQFKALQATLASLRGHCHDEYTELRGAGPQLTVAKHQLRDWVESRLTQLPEQGNANRVSKELNEAVDQAKLREYESCDQNEIGLLGQVEIRMGRWPLAAGMGKRAERLYRERLPASVIERSSRLWRFEKRSNPTRPDTGTFSLVHLELATDLLPAVACHSGPAVELPA